MHRIFTSLVPARLLARVWLLLLSLWMATSARSQTLPCDAARLEAHAGNSSCTGCSVSNPAYAVDDNMISASSLNLLPLGGDTYVQQTLYFNTPSVNGDSAHLYLSFLNSVLDLSVLRSIQLATYNGATYNNDRTPLGAPAFRIRFVTPEQALISWAPAKTFNKIEVRLTNSPSTLLRVNIHYASRGAAAPVAPASVSACSGAPTVLQATSPPGTSLQWYTDASGGCPVYEGAQFQTPVLTDTVTYYVATAKGACVTPQRIPVVVNVQPGVSKQWDKTYGGSQYDNVSVIVPTRDGKYFLGGITNSKDGNVTSPTGGQRAWVTKVGPLGGILWNRTYTEVPFNNYYQPSTLRDILPLNDGTYLLAGTAGSSPWVAKIDSNGNKLWDKSQFINGYFNFQLTDAAPSADGGFLLVGHADTYGPYDVTGYVIKIDANGNELWHKTFGGSGNDFLKCILPAADGGFYLGGYTASRDGDIGDGNNGLTDFWLIKITAAGNKVWDKTLGGTGGEMMTAINATSDGGLLLGGTVPNFPDGDVSGGLHGTDDIWLVKTDANGNKLWDKAYGGTKADYLATLVAVSNGFVLGGTTTSADGDITDGNNGDRDYLIMKIDEQGNKLWDKTYGGPRWDELSCIYPAPDGGLYVGGLSHSYSADKEGGDVTEPNMGLQDAWLIKLADGNCSAYGSAATSAAPAQPLMAASAVTAKDATAQQTVLTAYPNPFTRQLQLRYTVEKSARVSLQLFDMQGKQIANLKEAVLQAGVYNETVEGSNIVSGTYICRLMIDGAMYSQTVVKL